MIEIQGNNEFATVTTDFEVVRTRLKENPNWGAELLEQAGEYSWRVTTARWYSKGPFGARVIDDGPESFVAWGFSGKRSFLVYRISKEGENTIQVIPLAFQPRANKVLLVVFLALIYLIPVLLSPLLWRMFEVQTLRASRVFLPTFARYLEGV